MEECCTFKGQSLENGLFCIFQAIGNICFVCVFFLFVCLFFCLFKAAPAAYRGYQARGQIGATAAAAGLCHSHSTVGSKLCLQPTRQLMTTLDH